MVELGVVAPRIAGTGTPALVPPPRMHLTRYHGVLAPHNALRAAVTPAARGVSAARPAAPIESDTAPSARHAAMSWARRLERVFGLEIERCAGCSGRLRILARIEAPAVIARVLAHLERTVPDRYAGELPLGARAPPGQVRLL